MKMITDPCLLIAVSGGRGSGGDITRGEIVTGSAAIGGGYGAALTLNAAGSFAALPAALPAIAAYAAYGGGLGAVAVGSYEVGSVLYKHSETVQNVSQWIVGGITDGIGAVATAIGDAFTRETRGKTVEKSDGDDGAY